MKLPVAEVEGETGENDQKDYGREDEVQENHELTARAPGAQSTGADGDGPWVRGPRCYQYSISK